MHSLIRNENARTLISNQETVVRSSKRPKLNAVKTELACSLVDQVDFHAMFRMKSPRMPDDSANYNIINSMPITEKQKCPLTAFNSEDAQTLAHDHVETPQMADMFLRIEAIYI